MLLAPRLKVVVLPERCRENVCGGRLHAATRGEADGAAHARVRVVATDALRGRLNGVEEAVDLKYTRRTETREKTCYFKRGTSSVMVDESKEVQEASWWTN